MTPEFLAEMRSQLDEMRREAQAQIDDLTTGDNEVTASDPAMEGDASGGSADNADAMFDAEMNLSLINTTRDRLELIDAALERMERGTYGYCVICGKPIDEQRLQVLPYTPYCLDDQRKLEEQAGA
jgi:DnaK suppressor protein